MFVSGRDLVVQVTWSTSGHALRHPCRLMVLRLHHGRTLPAHSTLHRILGGQPARADFPVSSTPGFCGQMFWSTVYSVIGTPLEEEWPSTVSIAYSSFLNKPGIDLERLVPQMSGDAKHLLQVSLLHAVPNACVECETLLIDPLLALICNSC